MNQFARTVIQPTSEAHWLALREPNVNSTEVAALFGASPYLTEFQLYHLKAGTIVDDFEDTDRTVWGRRLEASIAEGVAQDYGLIVRPFKEYIFIPELRLGASFDYRIIGLVDDWTGDEYYRDLYRQHGDGIMEVKNVDGFVFRKTWEEGENKEVVEAPPHIEFQVQNQMEVAELGWCLIAALVGGNTPKILSRFRDTDLGTMICNRVAEFWRCVDAEESPDPDFTQDTETINKLFAHADGSEVDLSGNDELVLLCEQYRVSADIEKEAVARKVAKRAEILTIVGSHSKVRAGNFKISATEVKENLGTEVTPAMIGSRVGASKGYRLVKVTA